MTLHKTSKLIFSTLIVLNMTIPAIQAKDNENNSWNIKLGALSLTSSTAWHQSDIKTSLLPFFDISKGNWQFDIQNPIKYQTHVNESLSVWTGLSVRNDSYDAYGLVLNDTPKSDRFTDHKIPDTELLHSAGLNYGWLSWEVSRDISDNSNADSSRISLDIPLIKADRGFSISTELSANWFDSNYVNYYYGVQPNEIKPSVGRLAYESKSAINYELSLKTTYPINQKWIAVSVLTHTELDEEIYNSPLADEKSQQQVVLLLIYQF